MTVTRAVSYTHTSHGRRERRLQIQALQTDYAAGRRTAIDTLRRLHQRAREARANNVWITLHEWPQIESQLLAIEARRAAGQVLPLYGMLIAALALTFGAFFCSVRVAHARGK